jgi:hypothetical protein
MTLLNLIKPFKYSFCICNALPNDKMVILEVGLPFLIGIQGTFAEHREYVEGLSSSEDNVFIGTLLP